ncbi:DNA helicase/exodeoxyribonuclease V gamma subunit [Luteibacter rhizovicinus]|uniref:RecBCD enzyme subunit RecC n=1 Tax=Luteibacter rhizovicinus TaxID=242606 RepID=A0A4R3YRA8_9GAMM|nr:exodeoxyribonuclease V subunit gamma [Luteibacter rhizovicinus]TCV94902.1 DNA helicase/exodeoxyribonuclease V gamma subunit [Luteibacter rhizovicinus]
MIERSEAVTPGFMVLHGNRLEELRDVLAAWLQREPLAPLENEVVLVQSNGIAQWFKLALARDRDTGGLGISAAVDVQLPGRFLWVAYRAVLGRDAVPPESPFDKSRLVWRLMRLLPHRLDEPVFAPLAAFLGGDDDARKRYQLAERLADLYDQYQVYRADWLDDWAAGEDVLRDDARGSRLAMPPNDRWQAALWRVLLEDVGPDAAHSHRAAVHQAFLHAVSTADSRPRALPRRIVVFGMSSLPRQTLEALSALSRWCQVLMVVMNPCRHYWADIVEDRELLRAERRRQTQKPGMPALPSGDDLHLHAHPLLAAWGKQGRDYIRLLDEFDHADGYRERFTAWEQRIDLFDEPEGQHLLAQVQRAVLDLEPLPVDDASRPVVAISDTSIAFHVAHGPQREVEILHDQLLARFADAASRGDPIMPRDVIVMVPDIETYGPHIEAVFGRIDRDDPRFIPFSVADRTARGTVPLVMALDMLLGMPESRFTVSDVIDLIDVAAVRARFNLDAAALPVLHRWIEGAGIRWGLDAAQRSSLDLPAVTQNTWLFGLRRMLLGYAVGSGEAWGDIEPYDEVGGLDAALVGPLADLLDRLAVHWAAMTTPATPEEWGVRLRALLGDFFSGIDREDAARIVRLEDALEQWQRACADGGLVEALPLAVVREAWLTLFDQGSLSQRFLAGAVSFGTLMPMRAIPFRVVCLLGMNDGDYPRARPPMDFDLMSRAGAWRPGDRSRREDDRYLFLEALLSARDALHIGWVGRSARDNSERAPSVLLGQLRDYLAAGWRGAASDDVLAQLTVVHPLQPFSRDYFVGGDARLFTYAREWRQAHEAAAVASVDALPPLVVEGPVSLGVLRRFLRHPVREFFNLRLGVRFDLDDVGNDDIEPFVANGLDRHTMADTLLRAALRGDAATAEAAIADAATALRRQGVLPLAGFATPVLRDIEATATAVHARYLTACRAWPNDAGKRELRVVVGDVVIEDWLADLRSSAANELASFILSPSSVLDTEGKPKWHRLLAPWVDHLVAQAAGMALQTRFIGPDATVVLDPVDTDMARAMLQTLIAAWREGMRGPLPVAAKTALAWVAAERPDDPQSGRDAARATYESSSDWRRGEVDDDPYLIRSYPDFTSLDRAGLSRWLAPYRDVFDIARVEGGA